MPCTTFAYFTKEKHDILFADKEDIACIKLQHRGSSVYFTEKEDIAI